MAKGVDELVNHILSEVALTGVQGAGSVDFKRFVQSFYNKSQGEGESQSPLQPGLLSSALHEKVWHWVIGHADIRISHHGKECQYTLAEFEAAERPDADPTSIPPAAQPTEHSSTVVQAPGPAKSLLALRNSVRQRLAKEGLGLDADTARTSLSLQNSSASQEVASGRQPNANSSPYIARAPRVPPTTSNETVPLFDDPQTSSTAPRLFASQSRIWQALTGHGIDLKKVPTMEFVLLSLIASHGEAGVTQPDLTIMSGQDKRSVPHRTDELCRKGYIEKRPIQFGKLRTSLCVHKKYVSDDHFLTSGKVEDVFQHKTFVLSGFVHLLYNSLKDAGVVPTRDIRKRLNVPMATWNKRAVQGALIRLDQTGMVKRFRARRKDAEETWLTCIEVLREPRPEDHENLKFRRQATADEADEEQSDEEVDGDTLMRDLEVEMLNIDSQEADGDKEDAGRVPPQWVPERLLSNTLYEVIAMGGPEGWDSGVLRDRIVGRFWRRPMESYLTRLTDDWEATQPAHLRHLALIRDTRNTQEKKFVHYVYRTHGNFQKAADAGEVIWAGVSKPAPKQSAAAKGGRPKPTGPKKEPIDAWGFRTLNPKDFLRDDGSGSLSDCRAAIVHGRKYGPRWDNSFVEDIGYKKIETPKTGVRWTNDASRSKPKSQSRLTFSSLDSPSSSKTPARQWPTADVATDGEGLTPIGPARVMGLPKRKCESGLLTIEQRIALGLKAKGRLSKFVEDQIREHRKHTGVPTSIPDSIELERPTAPPAPPKLGPLMTKDERIAAGLPPRGRLGQKMEDQIREQRGLPKSVEKVKKPKRNRPANEPALLSKEQRIKLGIIPHGRLPQSLMEGLREERDLEISLEHSKVIPAYLSAIKEKKPKAEITRRIDEVRVRTVQQYDSEGELNQADVGTPALEDDDALMEVESRVDTSVSEKRKADDDTVLSQSPKRLRVEQDALTEEVDTTIPTPPSTASADVNEPAEEQAQQDASTTIDIGDEAELIGSGTPHQTSGEITEPPRQVQTEAEAKIDLIKEKYKNRSTPGLYLDPFARRSIGQGRPRNAFFATFRLSKLSSFDWFTQDPITALKGRKQKLPRSSIAAPVANHVIDPGEQRAVITTGDTISTEPQIAMDSSETEVNAAPSVADDLSDARVAGQVSVDLDVGEPLDGLVPSQSPGSTGTTPAAGRTDSSMESSQDDAQPVQQQTRPESGWNAINKPLRPINTYENPYTPSEPTDVIVAQATSESTEDANIQGVCGPITEEDMVNQNARKLAANMGTKTGGGSQKMFRHQIILQIIELCDGVYPMHGEIGRPFNTLWKRQYPNIAPPNSSTVLSNLRDMIADPSNGLKKLSFLIRLRQSAGLKKRDMVVYQKLTPTSPQVTRLAYQMANYSNTKAHQYYPEEIRHLVSDESFYVPMPIAPKDATVTLERLNPSLQHKIKEANLERRRRYYYKQKDEESARDAQNAAVEVSLKQRAAKDGQPRAKRARLASLNDKNKRYRRAPVSKTAAAPTEPELEASVPAEGPIDGEPDADQDLTSKQPLVAPVVHHDESSAPTIPNQHPHVVQRRAPIHYHVSTLSAPIVRFYATNGTFSTEFGLSRRYDLFGVLPSAVAIPEIAIKERGKKRVRIIEPPSRRPSKKARVDVADPKPANPVDRIISPIEESESDDSSSTSSSSDDDDDDIPLMQLSKIQAKAMAKAKANAKAKEKAKAKAKARVKDKMRQRHSKNDPLPTLLERLTGLTGDANEPEFRPPKPKKHRSYQNWSERKKAQLNKLHRGHKYTESHDPVDKFKKLFCSLVIASSMAGGIGLVDWSIVEKVHVSNGFDLAKTKALWAWMQTNMTTQIAELTADFEDRYLDAYENNQIAAIEDPSTYDWANLVRWAMHNCIYPELSLPVYREALQQFIVDLSSFEVLDRPKWYREKTADRVRTQLQLQYPYTAPLHRKDTPRSADSETNLKARSWIRANTATPQSLYDSKTAHEKLRSLGDPVLVKVVGQYVDRQMLRMRKFKRLLPGRNYTFTARLAKKYGRIFELSDFMAAVKIKKAMDVAFTQEDPEKCFYSVSRSEPDGAVMAIMSLLSQGKVRFTPQVPAVNNEFGAPLPRLSVWGFMEGDYVHRGIDRQRMFWDVHVVPTETYDYGNPLQPKTALPKDDASSPLIWSPLPPPPLPGKHDSNALLPIWSSMDGQHVTWPWWYRILNLVLQPLIFQPGATVEDIHANCDEYTTEIFEIELVLQWLISVNAVKKIIGGGYITLPGVWAAFGDVLHDMENDWLNEHLKRKSEKHEKQEWRDKYNLRFSTLQGRDGQQPSGDGSDESDMPTDDEREELTSTSMAFMRHPKGQYGIVREQIAMAAPRTAEATQPALQLTAALEPDASANPASEVNSIPDDAEMRDADGDGEMDADADADADLDADTGVDAGAEIDTEV